MSLGAQRRFGSEAAKGAPPAAARGMEREREEEEEEGGGRERWEPNELAALAGAAKAAFGALYGRMSVTTPLCRSSWMRPVNVQLVGRRGKGNGRQNSKGERKERGSTEQKKNKKTKE